MAGIPVTGGMRQAVLKLTKTPGTEIYTIVSSDGFRAEFERIAAGHFRFTLSRGIALDRTIIQVTTEYNEDQQLVGAYVMHPDGYTLDVYTLEEGHPDDSELLSFCVTVTQAFESGSFIEALIPA